MENKTLDHLETAAKKIENYTEGANMALTEMRLWNDTMAEMYKEERLEQQKSYCDQMDKMRKHYGKIIVGLIIALCILISGAVGGLFYVLQNFDFVTYYQELNENGGDANLYDGIHYND